MRSGVEREALEAGALAGGTDREVDAGEALEELVCGFRLDGDGVGGFGLGRCGGGLEQSAGSLEARVDVGRGHESIVANLLESSGQDVQHKAADELLGRERHGLAIARGEGDGLLRDVEDSVVGQCDSMGIAAQVGEDLLRTGEGTLGVDDEVLGVELRQQAIEATVLGQISWQVELSVFVGAGEMMGVVARFDPERAWAAFPSPSVTTQRRTLACRALPSGSRCDTR